MNDQTKKNTNKGIGFAVLGFLLIGGALVLIPRLVDEKLKSVIPKATDAQGTQTISQTTNPQANPTPVVSTTKKQKTAPPASGGVTTKDTVDSEVKKSPAVPEAKAVASSTGPWELILVDKYEPDEASKNILAGIIEEMKQNAALKLNIVGINNINKSSKIAQMGANRIANTIIKDAVVSPERLIVTSEQQPDMTDVRVKISVQGGGQ